MAAGRRFALFWQQVKALSLVTTRAGRHVNKVVAVECTLTVVTLVAVVRRRHVVLLGGNIRDLTTLLALSDVVTLVAILPGMRCVRKYGPEDVSRLRCTAVGRDRVARRARADLALRRVTAKTVVVRCKRRRNMPSRAREIVTRDASLSRSRFAAVVSGMVELHVEALDERRRKGLDLVRVHADILMTDRAHRLSVAARELAQVTSDACLVARKVHL